MIVASGLGALATAPAVLVMLLAVLLLLALRAWTQIAGLSLTRQVLTLLDVTIGSLIVLFIVLVAIRFVTVG